MRNNALIFIFHITLSLVRDLLEHQFAIYQREVLKSEKRMKKKSIFYQKIKIQIFIRCRPNMKYTHLHFYECYY
jgi:hypothetical protein